MAFTLLDTKLVTTAPGETPTPAPPSVWEQWLPVLSSVMTMAMLGALVGMMRKKEG